MRMPENGKIYSVNEANADTFPQSYRDCFADLRKNGYTSRYIGSLVADFHRTLCKGGVFFYPPTAAHPDGKLRLLYEANPLAFIAEQAGGLASNGKRRVLDVKPKDIHQRTPLIIGSPAEVSRFLP
jgi:fructose-1,6-bisphosphatase I